MDNLKVKVLYKALMLLDCFDVAHPEYGVSELAAMLGMPKSTVHNILSTYEAAGYMTRTRWGHYRLSNKFLKLSNVFCYSSDLRSIAKPFMHSLCERFDLTVYLCVPYETKVLYLEGVFHSDVTHMNFTTGKQEPLYCTGVGKAMLAYLGENTLKLLEEQPLCQVTEYTITDMQKLRAELERIRECGYATDYMENYLGVCCVGVPLFSASGELIGGMSVSGSNIVVNDEKIPELAGALQQAAAEIKELYR